MKLRTEMVSFHGTIVLVDPTMDEDVNRIALRHDAAAAHALNQALDEVVDKILSGYARSLIDHRASEIMAQWGFEGGEDA